MRSGYNNSLGICPSCRQHGPYSDGSMIKNTDDMQLQSAICSNCQLTILFMSMGQGAVTTSIAVVTDLSTDDVERFWNADRIQESDIIALHEMMQKPAALRQLLYKD